MVYKSFLCSIGQSTYCVLDRFRLNGSFYIGRFTTKREAFELSKKDTFRPYKARQKQTKKTIFKWSTDLIHHDTINTIPYPPTSTTTPELTPNTNVRVQTRQRARR